MTTTRETRATKVLDALGIKYAAKGRRAWARCPFHDDHDPSWFVDIFKGGHHCFSCKASGTLTELVEHVRSCSLSEAIEFVKAAGKGWEPPAARVRVVARAPKLSPRRFQLPREVYIQPLEKWPSPIRNYAAKRRIDAGQVERFGLGYAVDGRLQSRVILPVRDRRGRPVGYSARDFTNADERRYLTPHESELADLNGLFGEHLWPDTSPVVVVTEGAFNALAVDRAFGGSVPVAAIGGSDARPGHATKLAALVSSGTVVLLTDPDDAGDDVAAALGSMLARYARVERLRLQEGSDADTLDPRDLRKHLNRFIAS